MSERYPNDATLLALAADAATGVEYIPTGLSPYHLAFRKLVHRLAAAAQRANDLRVYQDGDLSIGVRPGRCFVGGEAHDFAGVTGAALESETTTHVWRDDEGELQTGDSGLPDDLTAFIPLAVVETGSAAITGITDLRGEVFLAAPSLAALNLTVDADTINAALDGANASVTAAALNALTAGQTSTADARHRHLQVYQDADEEVYFRLYNFNDGPDTNVALVFSLPDVLLDDTVLLPNRGNGFLSQRYFNTPYNLVGTVHAAYTHGGDLSATQTGKLVGVVPISGVVSAVILSVATNIVSTTGTDGITAVVKVNGTAVTSTDPKITSAAGTGFRSTAQGHGTASVVKTDGTQNVQRGDVLTVDLTRTAAGSVSVEAANVVVLVVIRAGSPE